MKELVLKMNPEEFRDLQRIDYSILTQITIIDHLFNTHKNDPDASIIDSAPFQEYVRRLEENQIQYDDLKSKFTEKLKSILSSEYNINSNDFAWSIPNFLDEKVIITFNN